MYLHKLSIQIAVILQNARQMVYARYPIQPPLQTAKWVITPILYTRKLSPQDIKQPVQAVSLHERILL